MPYITVRYTPNDATHPLGHPTNSFAGTRKITYIDGARANFASSHGTVILGSLEASFDESATAAAWNGSCAYSTAKSPHEALDILEGFGYRVVAAVTVNQGTVVWTLHKQR